MTPKLSLLLLALALAVACARPAPPEADAKKGPIIEKKELKPEIWPVPQGVKDALPGLLNDNLYLYREISPTVNLVAELPDYAPADAVARMARAFEALTQDSKFETGIDFWIIQAQPKAGPQVLVWGVRPSEAKDYLSHRDLPKFFRESEYVLFNDKILAAGPERDAVLNPPPAP